MRLALYALLALGGIASCAALLAWFAERSLLREADARSTADLAQVAPVEVALVLGTAPIGPEGGPNRYLVYRLDAAAALWHAGKVRFLLVSGNREGSYDEPTAMRVGLIARGVPAAAIYRDFAGYRTRDSILRARDVFGLGEFIVVSQRFHVGRALFIARHEGIGASGFDARDVVRPHSMLTELRRYPSALIAYLEVLSRRRPHETGRKVSIGVDPPD
ncbi:MAG: YdcF family protein [Enhydrobacter sp.]|nr:MAG: YdcF family protein [Enhydrobacter sp.]